MAKLKDYLPTRNAQLVTWSNNFSARISATPLLFGLTAPQAASFADVNTLWIDAYVLASNEATDSRANKLAMRTAKVAMIDAVRPLVRIVQAFPGLTDAQRADLGITVPKQRTPRPAPTTSPVIEVVESVNHSLKLLLREAGSTSRRMPKDVSTAYVYTYVGATAPTDINEFAFQGSTSRTEVTVAFPPSTPAGAKVWITACWLNPRQMPGPLCTPVGANIAGGVSGAGETSMKIAA